MDAGPDQARIRSAVEQLSAGRGTLEELDEQLEFLKRSVPGFHTSNLMLSLERIVLAKHRVKELTAQLGEQLSRDELVSLVEKVCTNQGTDIELDAYLELVERHVPHPSVSDLIFWSNERLTPEEIIDRALRYEAAPRRP